VSKISLHIGRTELLKGKYLYKMH